MRIKNFFLVITIFIFLINSSHAILEVKKLPYEDAVIEKIYKLDNGKFIYIEQFVRGHIISVSYTHLTLPTICSV